MKKIMLISSIVFILFSGCSRVATKGNETDTPAKATDTSNITANITSSGPGEEIARGGDELTEEVSVETGASTEFAVISGMGMMSVSIPQGALPGISQLNVAVLTGSPEGNLCPGFLCEDKAKPGEHLMLSAPAVITYWQQEPLPEDAYIAGYSDDLKEIWPLSCVRLETSDGLYGLMTQVDSFSAYGVFYNPFNREKPIEEIEYDFYTKQSYIWRIEAEGHEIRANNILELESLDESYYIYADSGRAREKLSNIYNIPRFYRGAMYINQFMIAKEKGEFGDEEVPLAFLLYTADNNLKLTIIPKFKKGAPKVVAQKDGISIVSLTEFELPVFDGYIGWGNAKLTVQGDAGLGAAVVEGGWDLWEAPITIRIKGAEATVRFVNLFLGPVELKGRFFGMEKSSPANPGQATDPAKSYFPGKPDNLPPKADNPLGDLEGVTLEGNKITQTLEGGGTVSILFPPDEEEEENSLTISDFHETWNITMGYREQLSNPDNWDDDSWDDDSWDDDSWDY
ncbi:MAG TPA: hypothetical protein GXZ22_00410 [Clostridiaceae bacterium]|nr:hypothetical protein [Clostridiaceae bacterium]